MRMKTMLLLSVLLLSLAAMVGAQDSVPCGGLSGDDCTLFTDAQVNAAAVDSATFTFELVVNAETDGEAQEFTISGDGAFSGAQAISAVESDGAALSEAAEGFVGALGDFDAELNVTISLPEEVAAMSGAASASEVALELRLVDGVGYINFDTLAEVSADAGMDLAEEGFVGWGGLDFVDLFAELEDQGMLDFSALDEMNNTGATTAMFDPTTFGEYVTVTRDADTSVDGANAAVFTVEIDLAGALNDDAIREAIIASSDDAEEAEEQLDQAAEAAADGDFTFVLTYTVGTDDRQLYAFNANISGDASATSEDGGPFNLQWNVTFSDINSAPAIEAPADAQVAPTEDVLQFFMGMMGGMGGMR